MKPELNKIKKIIPVGAFDMHPVHIADGVGGGHTTVPQPRPVPPPPSTVLSAGQKNTLAPPPPRNTSQVIGNQTPPAEVVGVVQDGHEEVGGADQPSSCQSPSIGMNT